jgi:CRISPR-associated protein Cmr1
MVLDGNGFSLVQRQIKAGQTFILRFIPLRPVRDEEWCLLNATLRLIADYEAIGGKRRRGNGRVKIVEGPQLPCCSKEKARVYVSYPRWRTGFKDNSFPRVTPHQLGKLFF